MATADFGHDEPIVGINVTPLVDITLVLLILFMVTAKIVAAETIPFDLPKAASAADTQVVFAVLVDDDGHAWIDGRAVDDAALRRAGADALARDWEVRTVVQASARASHGKVLHVLDELRRAGVQRIAFGTEKVVEDAP